MGSDNSRTYNGSDDYRRRAREQARAKAARDKREWRQEAQQSDWQRRQRGHQQLQNQPWRSKFADLPQTPEQMQERKQVYRTPNRGSQYQPQRQQYREQDQLTERQRKQAELIQEQERRARQQVQQRAAQQKAQEQAARQRVLQDQQQMQRSANEQRDRQERRHLQLQSSQGARQYGQDQMGTQHQAQQRNTQQQTVQQREAQLRAEQRAAAQRAAEQVQLQNARAAQALEGDYSGMAGTDTYQSQNDYEPYADYPAYEQDAGQYSRDSYTARSDNTVNPEDFYEPTASSANYARTSGRYSQQYASDEGERRQIPFKLIGIIVAIFAIVVILFVLNPLGCGGGASASSQASSSSSSTTKTQTTTTATLPTPIMSESSGITMHSAVAMKDLTEILIHNASYEYANEITTKLKEATNTEIIAAHGTGRNAASQPTGNQWMTGEFIRCYREGNAGPIMSAIDCGGAAGATVYAPVSGTVVLVKDYKLYDQIDDYRVHIQPDGREDLDVVLIHLEDVDVKAGDRVVAGETPIAKIRDVEQFLGDSMQLKQYTATGDPGNHTHIQVNNANHPDYHGLDDLKPSASKSSSSADSQISS